MLSGFPSANNLSWDSTNLRPRGSNAVEFPPTWGTSNKFLAFQSGWPAGSGSGSVTSSAAKIRPEFSSAITTPFIQSTKFNLGSTLTVSKNKYVNDTNTGNNSKKHLEKLELIEKSIKKYEDLLEIYFNIPFPAHYTFCSW